MDTPKIRLEHVGHVRQVEGAHARGIRCRFAATKRLGARLGAGEMDPEYVALVDEALRDRSTNAYESLARIILHIREHDGTTKYAPLCQWVGRMADNKCPAATILKYIVEEYPK